MRLPSRRRRRRRRRISIGLRRRQLGAILHLLRLKSLLHQLGNNAKQQQQQQQRKAEAQKAAGVKTPERKRAGFGSTFFEGESSEEDTFYSFASNDGPRRGRKKSAGLGNRDKDRRRLE